VSFVDGWRDRYHQRMIALLQRKLPPEILSGPKVNPRRELSGENLTRYEDAFHVSRQHWIVLVRPFLGLLSGVVLLTRPPGVLGALVGALFAGILYTRVPLRQGRRERLVVAVLGVILVVAAPHLGAVGLIVLAVLLAWPVFDFLDWSHEILVVTNKRVLNLHGIMTVQRPSVKISSIAFSNCISGPIGTFFHYGTIDLDTSSQRDEALSNLEYVPHAYDVWRLILQLHSEHRRELGDQAPEEVRRRGGGPPPPPPPGDG
jgi:hypothetical protein